MAQTIELISSLKKDILAEEKQMHTGGHLTLNEHEMKVNKLLMDFKRAEIQRAREKGRIFPPAHHFVQVKTLIDKSNVFKLIQLMPKGSVLHVHSLAMADIHWIIHQATYDEHCYMRILPSNQLQLQYFDKAPREEEIPWQSVKQARGQADSPEKFDDWLYSQLTLVQDEPHKCFPTQDDVWCHFQSIFKTLSGLSTYATFFRAHLHQSISEFYQDNVQYIEIRGMILQLYELDGTKYDRDWTMAVFIDVVEEFMQKYPDFCGSKLILSVNRSRSKTEVLEIIKYAIKLREKYPNYLLGFDLVGQEDQGNSLEYYMDELLYPSQLNPRVNLPYFFHAGETTWKDTPVDRNVIDALLLNTCRIGHGFALPKHPKALMIAKERGVAVEVNPISNQVLQLVSDLRDHPASIMLTSGCPVVVSSDGPALWGASGVSYDYYEFFMGIAGADADLAFLKTLFVNSIKYSGMSSAEKQHTMEIWEIKWTDFIKDTIKLYNL